MWVKNIKLIIDCDDDMTGKLRLNDKHIGNIYLDSSEG